MEIKIVEQRPNPLLKRTEYRFEIGHTAQSTPSRDSIRGELAKDLHIPKERIVVERMHSKFGTPKTVGEAMVYASTDDAKAVEREHVLIRNRIIEKAVATETPAPETTAPGAPPAEKPAEKAAEKPAGKPAEKPADKPAEKPAGKPTEKPADKSAEKPADKPTEKSAGKASSAKPKEA